MFYFYICVDHGFQLHPTRRVFEADIRTPTPSDHFVWLFFSLDISILCINKNYLF